MDDTSVDVEADEDESDGRQEAQILAQSHAFHMIVHQRSNLDKLVV